MSASKGNRAAHAAPEVPDEVAPEVPDEVTPEASDESGAASPVAIALEAIRELTERVERVERAQADADARMAAARSRTRPAFVASEPRRERRMSEGERLDAVELDNARATLMEPAGDGVPTGAHVAGVSRGDVAALNPPA